MPRTAALLLCALLAAPALTGCGGGPGAGAPRAGLYADDDGAGSASPAPLASLPSLVPPRAAPFPSLALPRAAGTPVPVLGRRVLATVRSGADRFLVYVAADGRCGLVGRRTGAARPLVDLRTEIPPSDEPVEYPLGPYVRTPQGRPFAELWCGRGTVLVRYGLGPGGGHPRVTGEADVAPGPGRTLTVAVGVPAARAELLRAARG
ncbi:hypothetical protein [Streptomyces sp. SPB074]|uniref:hypothetical protein n=1 Tax=Streptomyces sp. (strain SPB074) TaxID=465543 RepID=UPI000565E57F|nr:hypothetical protein [Streptomyces sp. SPB074]